MGENTSEMMMRYGYKDLLDLKYVYDALLGHGLFFDALPPCFTSESLLADNVEKDILEIEEIRNKNKKNNKDYSYHACIQYASSRHKNIPRQFAIPHPESYMHLCQIIKENWEEINLHIGKANPKFNHCHVRRIIGKPHIFEMSYEGVEKDIKEDKDIEYSIGASLIVQADIATCFPSIYSHSIPWAIRGKNNAKKTRDHWSDEIDARVRNIKDKQTNGLLIGPHASNIISEIILTQIDVKLRKAGYEKVIRNIDDYVFYAVDEKNAQEFLKDLENFLKEYELLLNPKKVKILPYEKYLLEGWKLKLYRHRFTFPSKSDISFTAINSYINYALELAHENNDYATLKYIIKVIANKTLSHRARNLYVKKILSIVLLYPYLLPVLEPCVLKNFCKTEDTDTWRNFLFNFLPSLFTKALAKNITDALAFCFYYGIRYNFDFIHDPSSKYEIGHKTDCKNPECDLSNPCKHCISKITWIKDMLEINDCVSMLLAWKFCKTHKLINIENYFNKHAHAIVKDAKDGNKRKVDRFWLFVYEVLDIESLTEYESWTRDKSLLVMKEHNISFLKF